jgi:hypothetical protein
MPTRGETNEHRLDAGMKGPSEASWAVVEEPSDK